MSDRSHYRADIDGLRAVAVLAVVLYHYGFGPSGGFVGVDVFFVISGYLITGILYREISSGQFSVLKFYDRRMRRILPALLLMIGASVAAGWFLLMPGDYDALGWQAASAAVGASNFYYLGNTGYFDQSADLLPLLHTWSLAVEEQFYLVWPLLMLILWRFFGQYRRAVIVALCAMVMTTFAASLVIVERSPEAAFYMLPTRAWELALGALVCFAPAIANRLLAQLAPLVGLALIGFASISLTDESLFPGLNALMPCLGAALVVWPRTGASLAASVLSIRPAVWIGKISYSLYLWHWPVWVFYRHYINQEQPSAVEASVLLLFAVAIAYGSWRFVETPVRVMRIASIRAVKTGFAAMALVSISALLISQAQDLSSRFPQNLMAMSSLKVMWDFDCPHEQRIAAIGKVCVVGDSWDDAERHLILWGDSNAAHLLPIVANAIDGNTSVALYYHCPATLGGDTHRYRPAQPGYFAECVDARRQLLELLSTGTVDAVILAASWSDNFLTPDPEQAPVGGKGGELFEHALLSTVEEIKALGVEPILVANFPSFEKTPVACYLSTRTSLLRRPCAEDALTITTEFHQSDRGRLDHVFRSVSQETGAHLIVPGDKLCTDTCITELNGEFLYRDRTHLRRNLQPDTLRLLAARLGLQPALH